MLGQEFDRRVLAELEPERLKQNFRSALIEQIWSRAAEYRYRFNHTLLRDAAYNMQLRSQLMEPHAQAGAAYEAICASDLSPHFLEIAYHFRQARILTKERHYTYLAAQQASERFAFEDARQLHLRALELTDEADKSRRFSIALELETIYRASGDRSGQFKTLQLLRELSAALGMSEQAQASQRQALLYHVTGAYHESISSAETAIRLARENADIHLELDGRYLLGANYMRMGNYKKATAVLEAALAIAHIHELRLLAGKIETNLGHVAANRGQFDDSREHYRRSLELAQEVGDKLLESYALNGLGAIASDHTGRLTEALTYLHESLKLKEEVGDVLAQGITLKNLSKVHYNLGNFEKALELNQQSLHIRREVDDRRGEGKALTTQAAIELAMGDLSRGEIHVREALGIALEVGEKRGEADAFYTLAELMRLSGRLPEARAAYQASHEIRDEIFEPHRAIMALSGIVQVEAALGNIDLARSRLEQVVEAIDDLDDMDRFDEIRLYLALHQIMLALDDPRNRQMIEQAYDRVQMQADAIGEDRQRRQYLLQVAWNRAVLEHYHRAEQL